MSSSTNEIILASASPRRAQLLRGLGIRFSIEPSQVIEAALDNESPTDYITRIARAKALDVARRKHSGLIIAADTEVIIDGQILGKPKDFEDASRMLRLLSSRWHAVITGVALCDAATGREAEGFSKTIVRFAELTPAEIDWYVASGEPFDKAGGYGIQGLGSVLVEEISGSYHNVVGLPLRLLYKLASELGRPLFETRCR
ncbi:MAG TPA: Maf family protein [Blastocatellia bacterium]